MMAEQDVLAKTLPQPVAPSGKGRVGFKEAMGIDQPFLARKSELQPEISKADADIAKAQQEQKEIESTGKLSAQMRFGQQQEAAMTGMREKMEKEPLPAFIPSKDNAQDIAGLFGVISVISMLIGGGGKMSGQLALGNMNGMMEGYRKGREDLYKKERTEFDKNFKAMMQKHAEFRQEMEDAVKLAVTNKEEGMRAAELAAAKAGSDIVKAQLRKGDLVGAYKLVDESQKGAQHALQMEQKAKAEEARARESAQRAREAADLRRELVGMSLAAKASGTVGKALPKDKETNNEHRFRHSAIKNVQEVLTDLQDPEIRRLIGPMNQYLPDVVLNLRDKYPALAQKLARFQSEEFKIGGKSLTASEQKILGPIYNWRGLTAKALEDNLKEAERAMDKEQLYLESRYPGLGEINYDVTPSSKYSVGQIIEKGNKKFRVIDISNPNDPDVEEVK
jgi:hypothetical protein